MGKSLKGVNWNFFSIVVLSDENGEIKPRELTVLLSDTSFRGCPPVYSEAVPFIQVSVAVLIPVVVRLRIPITNAKKSPEKTT